MCGILMSLTIVGAVETSPGWMSVDHLYQDDISTIYVPTATYQSCYANHQDFLDSTD